ncbi:MAG: RtcB family protein [Phycisphaeraceae bacterium]
MKARQLEKLGIPPTMTKLAKWLASEARSAGASLDEVRAKLKDIVSDPAAHQEDPHFGELAKGMALQRTMWTHVDQGFTPREVPAPWKQWGTDLEEQSIAQMRAACELPITVAGALMPDAHLGYGLPIGGVLATDNAVIPYAVGVDIACRMKLTVLDLPVKLLESEGERLTNAIEDETRFGMGVEFGRYDSRKSKRREHDVMDDDWNVSHITREMKDKAHAQLGTSGSGNHFVEFGTFTVDDAQARDLNLPAAGVYLALLSHSGSRGTGAKVCDYYSRLAMQLHPELPKELKHLAWLGLDTHEGQEYWAAMQLMGKYAAANHACIHRAIAKHLGARVMLDIENHHNFAWEEEHVIGAVKATAGDASDSPPSQGGVRGGSGERTTVTPDEHIDPPGASPHAAASSNPSIQVVSPTLPPPLPKREGSKRKVIVHRKGATPAQVGVLGIIPGSMASPGFVVRGKGVAASLESCSHGAGRVMSRTKARNTYRWPQVRDLLEKRGVTLLSAGIDEVPFVYKNIDDVMAAQRDLVDVLGRFDPRLVKMAPEGEKAED